MQNVAQSLHRTVKAVVKVDEGLAVPQKIPKLLARDNFAGTLKQCGEHLKWLVLDSQAHPGAAHLRAVEVYLHIAEAINARG